MNEPRRGAIVVEGQGEIRAVLNLVSRLWMDLSLGTASWANPIRGKDLQHRIGVERACELVRSRRGIGGLLILRDADDAAECPKQSGPMTARWVEELQLPFAASVVLFRREYETLFLPCLARMAGRTLRDDRGIERPRLPQSATYEGEFEAIRGVKEWLSRQFPRGRTYKPTLDQLPMTRLIDFDDLRTGGLPCFGTLERGLSFFDREWGKVGAVYPTAPAAGQTTA